MLFRENIKEKLETKKWFQKTDSITKKELFDLPQDFDGFLQDLTIRSDEFEGVDVLRLIKLARGNFIITPVFEVRSQHTNQIFTYEYASFKYGKHSGYRGILFLEVDGSIEYFVVKYTKKFALGLWVYDTIGDFIQYTGGELVNFPKKVEKEIMEELDLDELLVKRFINLGTLNTDVTLTNKQALLFAAVIDGNDSRKLKHVKDVVLETKKISFGVKIIPIKLLNEYVHKIDDSYFLACVVRLLATNVIKI